MQSAVTTEILRLQSMTIGELRARWLEVFGQETKQRHRAYLIRRLCWKLQEDRFGKLTPEQEARVAEYRREIEALPPEQWFPRSKANKAAAAREKLPPLMRDRRLPPPGSVLTREWRGNQVVVKILESGFEYDGRLFRSLSAVAQAVTGTSWNGWTFFGLAKETTR